MWQKYTLKSAYLMTSEPACTFDSEMGKKGLNLLHHLAPDLDFQISKS